MKIMGLSIFLTPDDKEFTVCLLSENNDKYIIDNKSNKYTKVDKFPLIHYKIKEYDNIENVFDFSKNYLNLDYFELHKRFKEVKRKVWIFKGDSVSGKTFLSDKISLSKYETDYQPKLPDVIKEDIIVIGNKYKFDIEDIKKRIYNISKVDVVIVNFSHDLN